MLKVIAGLLLLTTTLLGAPTASAGVVMCTDPVTGKKTFTDKACPTPGSGRKVKIEPTNFGEGKRSKTNKGAWLSDRDTSVAGRDNVLEYDRLRAEEARKTGYLPSES